MLHDLEDMPDAAEFDIFCSTRELTVDEFDHIKTICEKWLRRLSQSSSREQVSHCYTLLDKWMLGWAIARDGQEPHITGTVLDPLFDALDEYCNTLEPKVEMLRGDALIAHNRAYATREDWWNLLQETRQADNKIEDLLIIRGGPLGLYKNVGLIHPIKKDPECNYYLTAFEEFMNKQYPF